MTPVIFFSNSLLAEKELQREERGGSEQRAWKTWRSDGSRRRKRTSSGSPGFAKDSDRAKIFGDLHRREEVASALRVGRGVCSMFKGVAAYVTVAVLIPARAKVGTV